jgi:hypothetical protein
MSPLTAASEGRGGLIEAEYLGMTNVMLMATFAVQ